MGNARLDESQARIKIAKRKKKRLPREISTISDMQMIPLYGRKWRGTKEPLDEVKEESEKDGFKLNIQKKKPWNPIPSLHST